MKWHLSAVLICTSLMIINNTEHFSCSLSHLCIFTLRCLFRFFVSSLDHIFVTELQMFFYRLWLLLHQSNNMQKNSSPVGFYLAFVVVLKQKKMLNFDYVQFISMFSFCLSFCFMSEKSHILHYCVNRNGLGNK